MVSKLIAYAQIHLPLQIFFFPPSHIAPTTTSQSIVYNPPNIKQLIGSQMDGINYPTRHFQWPILQSHELLGFVEGTEPCPTKSLTDANGKEYTNPEYILWLKTRVEKIISCILFPLPTREREREREIES